MINNINDVQYMKLAIEQAGIAQENGDVPIGAVIVLRGKCSSIN